MRHLEDLQFDNTYARLPEPFHSRVAPQPYASHHLIHFNTAAGALIDLPPDEAARPELLDYLSGRQTLPGTDPVAMCYAGHQFGGYVPRLGDGRALLLGQVRNASGENWDLHLKGSGQTPYSRGGDGRAVLRSSIREYLCAEAMHGLGIPTTRSLCLIGSDDEVYREQIETGALLVRMAPSHVRFGSFEYFYYGNRFDDLRRLADYVIEHHYPKLREQAQPYQALLGEVAQRTARMIARWQTVGFAHGVMNTDNMSILGLTLDYGPYGFLDAYDPGFICNHSDHQGRYAFDRQPDIGLFNVSCLAQALLPLLSDTPEEAVEQARAELGRYEPALVDEYATRMRAKLGLRDAHDDDQALCSRLLQLMADSGADHTNTFRALCDYPERSEPVRDQFTDSDAFDAWGRDYRARLLTEGGDPAERAARMRAANPKYVLRNYLAQQAIDRAATQRDFSEIDRLLRLLQTPFDEQPDMEHYAAPPPDWARKIQVSCSS